ncbi:histidine kinase [Lachnospiraceae bacterium ZAX-1]
MIIRIIMIPMISMALFSVASNIYSVVTVRNQIKTAYMDMITLYVNQLDALFVKVDTSLKLIVSSDIAFKRIQSGATGFEYEVNKMQLQREEDSLDDLYENKFQFYFFNSEKDEYFRAKSRNGIYEERMQLDNAIKDYTRNWEGKRNDSQWKYVKVNQNDYLIRLYKQDEFFIGSSVKVNDLMEDIQKIISKQDYKCSLIWEDKHLFGHVDEGSYVQVSKDMTFANCKLVMYIPSMEMLGRPIILSVMAVILLIYGISMVYFSIKHQKKTVVQPLETLSEAMQLYAEGNLEARVLDEGESKEIYNVNRNFNNMAEEIKVLKIDVYEKEIEHQKVLNNFLKIQIKPHFYINILNLIHGLAQINDYKTIQELAVTMGDYFRYLLNNTDRYVRVEDEINCVENYLKLQKIRYRDKINYSCEVADNLRNAEILPVLIQTFVENSVKHNITIGHTLDVRIKVCYLAQSNTMSIQITDNGFGFPKDILDVLIKNENISYEGKQIGIQNAMKRLESFYGGEGSIHFGNSTQGSFIKIKFPYRQWRRE